MRLTVLLNSDCDEPEREKPPGEGGELDRDCGPRGGEELGDWGAGDWGYGLELPKIPLLEKAEEELEVWAWCLALRASEAALSRRLVVPRALVDPERAEQTTTTLFPSR